MSAGTGLGASVPPSVSAPPPRRPLWRRILGLPGTRLGWWSVGLWVAFFGSLSFTFLGWSGSILGYFAALGSVIAAAVTAAVAIFWKGERSLLVLVSLLLGLLILAFVLLSLR